MITNIYIDQNGFLAKNPVTNAILAWVDIDNPTTEEREVIEKEFNITLPLHHETMQLEFSNRYYMEDNALFMLVNVITKVAPLPETHMITFIVTPRALLTLRYADPHPIHTFIEQIDHRHYEVKNYLNILVLLLEMVVGKVADAFELVGERSDEIVITLVKFIDNDKAKNHAANLNKILREINNLENLMSKGYQSLASINMLLGFYEQNDDEHKENYFISNMEMVKKDVHSLVKHGEYLSQKLQFHLQSTLGLINIQQTQIVKMFTVLAMVFLPPTLLASVYGMNFKFMPELQWTWGYPMAIGLLVASAFIPYLYFKKKQWI
jgi:magnesium transporter